MTKTIATWGAGLALGLVLTGSLQAQFRPAVAEKSRPRAVGTVREMEIYEGGRRTVRYFGDNLSPSESTMLREMERLENEASYVRDLGTLKNQYVYSEKLLEPYRRLVQQNLYGVETTSTQAASFGGMAGYGNGWGYGGLGTVGYIPSYGGNNWGGGNYITGYLSDSTTTTRSLANGVGDEGRLKAALAGMIATQATPEYASTIERAADRVALQASATPSLSVAMGLPRSREMIKERDGIRQVEGEVTGGVTLTLKSGEKVVGKKMTEDKTWITVELVGGGRTRIRPEEVTRIDAAASGNAPALYSK